MKSHLLIFLFVLAMLFPIWFELGGVPVGARSDGRYAAVSMDMAQRSNWLVPYDEDGQHLTKPPLIYWAEALCIRWFGLTAFAVRIPSALAGSLVVIGTLLLGWKIAGRTTGILAAGLLSIMPLHLVISRLTLTDGLLAAGWFGVLAGAYLAVLEPRRWPWLVLLWVSMAVAWMTKGPVALIPLAGIFLWLIVGQRASDIQKLRPVTGLLLSLVPVAVWAILVWISDPQAAGTWAHEIFDRIEGGGNHPQGPWFFFGILVAGMIPATLAMDLPWLHRRWRDIWAIIRRGDDATFWFWAVVAPLIIFSIPSGKLASYILPLCPPLAIGVAMTLKQWITGEHDKPPAGYSPPDPHILLPVVMLSCAIATVVVAVVLLGKEDAWVALPFFIVPAASFRLMVRWRQPTRRAGAMLLVWLAIILSVVWGEVVAKTFISPTGTPAILKSLQEKTGLAHPILTTYKMYDHSLSYYTGRFVDQIDNSDELNQQLAEHGSALIVVARQATWHKFAKRHPQTAGQFTQVMTRLDWPPDEPYVYLAPVPAVLLPNHMPDTPADQSPPAQKQ